MFTQWVNLFPWYGEIVDRGNVHSIISRKTERKRHLVHGFVKKNYLYEYSNNLLKHYKYSKKVNIEYKINYDVRKNYKNKMLDLYTISDDVGIKKIVRDNYTSCSIVNITDTNFNSLQLFMSIYLKNIEDISNEEYDNKIKLLK